MSDSTKIDTAVTPHASTPPEISLVGQMLGSRYRVTKRLAEGGMGVVYEARDEVRGRDVAVKSLHAYLANDDDIEARFRREAHALAAISHPNVIEVYDSGTLADGRHYLVLELLTGRDLSQVLHGEGPMAVGRVARLLGEIAEGLAVAHDKGIIHRDLKPENVFLLAAPAGAKGAERIKVMDFGVARYAGAPVDARTRTGTTVGTPYYMAPEQAQGRKEIDLRADVYALGVMGFRMLTGHHPFDDDSYPMLVVKICTEPPPPISTWRADVPPELELLLDRMMSKTAGLRPGTMREVREALAPFMGLDVPAALTNAPPPSRALPAVLDGPSGFDRTQPAMQLEGRPRPHVSAAQRALDDDDLDAESSAVATGTNKQLWPFVVGGLGILCAGLFAWMMLGPDDGPIEEPEPDSLALPEPRPPTTHALRPGGAADGWGFVNPRPRVMPQWNAVSTAGPGIVAMVGANGMAARFTNSQLLTWRTGTDRTLYGVAWTSADDAIAVGEQGTIVRLDPRGARSVEGGTSATLRAVATLSATEEIAVGDDGAIVRLLGDRVLSVPVEGSPDLLAIDAREGAAMIVGEAGTVLRITDGHLTRLEAPTSQTLRAVGGCGRDLYVAGDEGVLLLRGQSGFRPVRVDPPTRAMFTSISCDRGRTVVVGAAGEVRLVSGLRSVKLESGFDGVLTGVSGAADEATWIVGTSGRLAVVVSDHVETRVSGPIASLRDIADIGGALVAVGDWGKLVRQREDGLVLDQAPSEAGLGSIARLGEGALVAVGDEGTIVRIAFEGATLLTSPTGSALRGVVAAEGTLLAVGAEGTVVRGTPASLVPTRLANVGDLAAITGTPSDAIAVGESGAIVRLGASGSRVVSCGVTLSLRGVVREQAAGPAFAVGEAGAVVRIEPDGSCVTERHVEGAPTLNGIGRGPDGRLLAVGDMGTAIARAEDGSWAPIDLDVGTVSLRAVRSIDRWVFVVGAGGVILRHIRVDGS